MQSPGRTEIPREYRVQGKEPGGIKTIKEISADNPVDTAIAIVRARIDVSDPRRDSKKIVRLRQVLDDAQRGKYATLRGAILDEAKSNHLPMWQAALSFGSPSTVMGNVTDDQEYLFKTLASQLPDREQDSVKKDRNAGYYRAVLMSLGLTTAGFLVAIYGGLYSPVERTEALNEKLDPSHSVIPSDRLSAAQRGANTLSAYIEGALDATNADTLRVADFKRLLAGAEKRASVQIDADYYRWFVGRDAEKKAQRVDLLGISVPRDGVDTGIAVAGFAGALGGLAGFAKTMRKMEKAA